MDVFYEESSMPKKAKSGERKYKILHIISMIFLVIGFIFLLMTILFIPDPSSLIWGMQAIMLFSFWFLFYKWKSRCNISYDYVFVSGELRISKVFNVNRRRLLVRIDCQDMIQVGDVDNPSFDRFSSDPSVKTIICTTNDEASAEKFFMYILAAVDGGKKLYVLECRENLLMNILKFAKRSTLESDYVMQDRKQK